MKKWPEKGCAMGEDVNGMGRKPLEFTRAACNEAR